MKKILVVDDSKIQCLLCTKLLENEFSVTCASTASEALQIVNSIEPDLIILDLMMPFMDGFEFMNYLQKNENQKKIPIIVCSALKDQTTKNRARQMNVAAYLEKPLNIQHLLKEIDKLLIKCT